MQTTGFNRYRTEVIVSAAIALFVMATIVYGQILSQQGVSIRRWGWTELLFLLPAIPLLFLQRAAGLPEVARIGQCKGAWWRTAGVGVLFGLLDVVVFKIIMHPQPYTELPPFLQPFPYSLFLYGSGATEVEFQYRLLPLTLFLLAEHKLFKGRWRKGVLVTLGIITSLIEPLMQWPEGKAWLVAYAVGSGIAMNAWQFKACLRYGAGGSLAVRLGHYLFWHILLGIYVQWVELA